ncbi:hemagglutinin repeat-containing protein [Yersinia kristensenii]|uniref:two-partner secretion domain-containing protein n=4 Tax=Yersinia kristensenii TaxID=28152 RepID=UPI001427A987|nr:hemagglutinin repeat-containing protein [Yersinia kristensenii]MDA5474357.1 hemagglutinin repeat-containing protein [Yersinia kristensenii]MDA5478707.1 hemagglutinin repeat-containing protein [Yersinia kristensenii]MDA5507154.1 hemagglutinin repeat-containing protein [Yersinia kristensenii]NIK95990.1 filamentous hemagglutinin N-terminal domain-containing protein [Yersinia kristensenii]
MNKNLYRIVFNKARGLLMVVADIAASGRAASSPSSGVGHTQSRRISALSPLSFSLLLALGCVSLSAQAGIVADGSAPGNQQPTIISSANGTPQVNIQTPSSGGVSRNVYSQFDVDNRGVILNNGSGVNQTQLGGFINGNPSLARGEASIILNEINSRDPSKLNGYIEVAGRKAQVVIANPSGITCDGCGFINANRATLTTGQAQLNNGQLTGYDVDRGEIVIQGKGLDSNRQDHTDLIARSVKVNAGIWASDLKVTAGRNQVDAAHQNINAKADDGSPRPTVAVDVANLGGMYAGKIRLIGTESGVGVRNAGEIGASAGDITITADGMLVNSGQINSAQQLAVNTTVGIDNAGVLYAQGNTQLTTAGKLSNSGTVAAAGDTSLRAAEVDSSRNSMLGAGVKSDNSSITSGTLRVDASGMLIAQGKNVSGTAQNFTARSIDLSGSQTQSRDLTLIAQGGPIELTGANLSASHRLSVSTASLLRSDNASLITEQVVLDAQALSNVGGLIAQTGATDFNLNLPGYVDNRDGTLISAGKFSLQAESLNSNGNSLLGAGVQSNGKLAQSGSLNVTTRQALIAQGQNVAAGAMTLSGSRVDLTGSQTSANNIAITARDGNISTQKATVLTPGALTITAAANPAQTLNNSGGKLHADTLELNLAKLDNSNGEIAAATDLWIRLKSDFIHQTGARLTAGRDLDFSSSGALINQYKLEAGRDMQLTALSISNTNADDSSALLAGRDLSLSSANLLNSGAIYAAGAGQFTVNGNTENRGEIYTEQQLTFTTTGNLVNSGVMQTRGDMRLSAQGDLNNSGTLYTAGDQMKLSITGDVTNQGKLYAANGNLQLLTQGNLDNSGSLYGAGNSELTTLGNAINSGSIYTQGALQWQADGRVHNSGSIAALGDLQLRANDLLSTDQSLIAAGLKADGNLANSGDLAIHTEQALIAQGQNIAAGALTLAGSQLDLTGSQTQAKAITLAAKSGDITLTQAAVKAATLLSASTNGLLRSDKANLMAEQMTLAAQALSNLGGVIVQTGIIDFTLNLAGYLDNRAGTLLAKGNVAVQAERLESDGDSLLGAGVQSNGRLTDVGNLRVTTRQELVAQGQNIAAGAMALTGSRIDLTGSQTQAQEINITANKGNVSTQHANILSLGSLTINAGANAGQTLNNQSGTLSANNIQLNLGQFDNSSGKVTASQDLTIGLQSDFNNLADSTLQAGGDFTFTTHGALTNDGQLLAGGKLSTHSSSLLNNGNIIATQAKLTTSGALINGGEILTSGRLDTDANTLFNSGTIISAEATLKARQSITNSGPNALIGATDENGTLALLAPVIENSDTLTHTDTAPSTTLLGMGKVILAGGQDSGGNYLSAAQVLNISGLIESGKDMLIYATTLTNRRHILTANTDFVAADTVNGTAYWTAENPDIPGGRYAEPPHGGSMNSDYIGTNYTSTIAYNGIDQISPEAQLLAGGNLTPQVGTLENFWSKVSAQGEIDLSGVTLQQDGWGSAQRLIEKTTSTGEWRYRTYKGDLWGIGWGPEISELATNQYASSLTAKTISGSGTIIHNGANPGAIAPPSGSDSTGKNIAIEFNGISLTLPSGGLYKLNTDNGQYAPDPDGELSLDGINNPSTNVDRTDLAAPDRAVSGGYLVETHPAFANLNNWRGSDYVLQQLNHDPDVIFKRLGDNAYEQRLVRDQVLALTGQAVASDYRSAQEQFEELFAAGLEYSKAFNLALGTHLSAEQMAALTRNIVLMETREVAGQTVLVPVVYLAGIKPGELHANGALIAANNIELTDMQGFTNQGTIKATHDLSISMAQDITLNNRGGLLQAGGNMLLSTLNSDIDLTSARLNATNLQLDSGRDVILRTSSEQLSSDNGAVQRSQTVLGPLASINVSNNATINTERDFIMQGAGLNVGQDLQVNTGGDWLLNTVQTRDQISANYGSGSASSEHIRHLGSEVNVGGVLTANVNNLTAVGANINASTIDVQAQNINLSAATDSLQVSGESSSKRHTSSVELYDETLRGSQLNATGDINLQAAKDINISASAVQTEGALKLAAGGDVILTTQTEQHDEQRNHTGTKKGLASSTTTRTEDSISQTLAVGSMLSAGSIDVSGKNIAVTGSHMVADNDINLRAQENITVGTAQQSESESHLFEQKKSGLMSTGGIGVMVGSSTKVTDTGKSISNVGSTVGSVLGNVSMTAGENLTVQGSDVLAGKDINLSGKNVSILAAENHSSQTHSAEQKSSGLTLALSGAVGSAANTAVTTAKDARDESNGRLAALQGVKAALSGAQAVQAGQLVQAQGGDASSMFGVSASLGSQKSSSQQHQEQTSVSGSTLTAGNNLTINATGDGNSANSGDILVQGSQLKAGGDTTLDAARDLLLLGAANTQKTDGSNSSSGGSVGVSLGLNGTSSGLSIFANANKGQGNEHGDGTTWTETTVDSGGTLSLNSGRDTSLIGAQASGESVKVDVGRDLLLQSQQDSDNYDAKQTSTNGGVSVAVTGGGSANLSMSKDKLHSNYDSVQEQSGIFAGSGGFDITVGEHTQLDGAVIASTATADKNTLDTGTLGFSNIENKADFKAEHQGGSLSTGGPVGSDLLSNLGGVVLSGLGNDGHAAGTTQAAVSEGNITIRDTDKQQQNVDDLSRDTDNANGSIGPIFDKEKEQNRLREAQLIGEIGGQAMDIARTQGDILGLDAALKANPTLQGDADALRETKEYKAEMQKYGTGSALQQGLQAATAAIQGLAGGNMAQALAGASAPYLAEIIHNMTTDPVTGKVNTEANLMAHAVLGAVLAQINGNSALAGASGAAMGEYIAQQMYPGIKREDLTEEQRQTISALGTLAAGLAGGLTGDSSADAVAGAQAGKNAVENNSLSGDQARESVKQVTSNLKDQVRDKLGEGTLSAIVNSIINATADTGDAILGGADYGADAAMALTSCAMGDSYCTQALNDLAGKNQAAADTLKALMKSETWEAVAGQVKEAAQGNQLALEATGGMLAGLFLPGKKLPDAITDAGKVSGGSLSGQPTKLPPNASPENIRSLQRENEGATILSQNGYHVEQNPVTPGVKNPDYKINGEVFDNIAPKTNSVRNIYDRALEKVNSGQTNNVVINLADTKASVSDLQKQFNDWPIKGLDKVIVIDQSGKPIQIK